MPVYDAVVNSQSLPAWLVLNGLPSPGGGESVLISLYTAIDRDNFDMLPVTIDGFREQLAEDLLPLLDKYK